VKPHFDLGFLLCLILNSPGRMKAWESVKPFEAPWPLTRLHQFQVENGLRRHSQQPDKKVRAIAETGQREWRNYLAEGVFQVISAKFDWEDALENAVDWNRRIVGSVPPPNLILHPSVAVATGATHFLSFDPRSRALAAHAGLVLVPRIL
jgi:hypothetical protein